MRFRRRGLYRYGVARARTERRHGEHSKVEAQDNALVVVAETTAEDVHAA
jgi:hypothetical protein